MSQKPRRFVDKKGGGCYNGYQARKNGRAAVGADLSEKGSYRFMGKYFGTDGFRGEAGVTLTSEHAYQIGRFLGWYYSEGGKKKVKAVIGKDTRRSSYMFEYAIVAGLTASGGDAYMLHVTTTPSVSYAVAGGDFGGGADPVLLGGVSECTHPLRNG